MWTRAGSVVQTGAAPADVAIIGVPAHRTSISPTLINAGYRINVIPSEVKATLDVRTAPGEGSAFRVWVPIGGPDALPPGAQPPQWG
mgnify:CR=1 FL=1